MWVMTKSDWPQLVNLSRAANIGYQEYVLAECKDGDEARALVEQLAVALASQVSLFDLRSIEAAGFPQERISGDL